MYRGSEGRREGRKERQARLALTKPWPWCFCQAPKCPGARSWLVLNAHGRAESPGLYLTVLEAFHGLANPAAVRLACRWLSHGGPRPRLEIPPLYKPCRRRTWAHRECVPIPEPGWPRADRGQHLYIRDTLGQTAKWLQNRNSHTLATGPGPGGDLHSVR